MEEKFDALSQTEATRSPPWGFIRKAHRSTSQAQRVPFRHPAPAHRRRNGRRACPERMRGRPSRPPRTHLGLRSRRRRRRSGARPPAASQAMSSERAWAGRSLRRRRAGATAESLTGRIARLAGRDPPRLRAGAGATGWGYPRAQAHLRRLPTYRSHHRDGASPCRPSGPPGAGRAAGLTPALEGRASLAVATDARACARYAATRLRVRTPGGSTMSGPRLSVYVVLDAGLCAWRGLVETALASARAGPGSSSFATSTGRRARGSRRRGRGRSRWRERALQSWSTTTPRRRPRPTGCMWARATCRRRRRGR